MNGFARVGSVEKLTEFRAVLCVIAQRIANALEESNIEIKQETVWLKNDCRRHWKEQFRLRIEQVNRARLELKRKELLDLSPVGARNSCVEERKALKAAQARLEQAQQKIQVIKKWTVQLEKNLFEYQGATQTLANMIDAEIPNALAWIDRMVTSLEAYHAVSPDMVMTAESHVNEDNSPIMTRPIEPAEPASANLDEKSLSSKEKIPSQKNLKKVEPGPGKEDSDEHQ